MRIPSVYSSSERQTEVMMTPMIDVVFLLLVFFIWTSSFQVVEHLLPSNIIAAAGTDGQAEIEPELLDLERIVIRILWQNEQPTWTVNGDKVATVEEVQGRLVAVAEIQSDLPVLLDPEQQVPLGLVIDIYDRARQVGFAKIQFAAEGN